MEGGRDGWREGGMEGGREGGRGYIFLTKALTKITTFHATVSPTLVAMSMRR